MCLNPEPSKNHCENYMQKEEICLNEEGTMCINWYSIMYAIIIANICQIIFESSMLCALEITLKPS